MVGSIPSFTRSGRSPASCSASRPSGSTSTALRVRSGIGAMLDCRLRSAGRSGRRAFSLSMAVLGLKRRRAAAATFRPRPRLPRPSRAAEAAAAEEAARPLRPARARRSSPLVSMVFGMMAAVSQDLPAIYNFAQYKASKNSEVFDANGEPLGTLTSDQNKILLNSGQISPNIKNAVVSIEDARFYEHSGVDFQGIGRALVKDILSQSAAQGASTITEQFVKNALEAAGHPHALRQVQGGGARLPARAPLEQGQDPHRVPEHDLLRRGRLRDRGGRPHLLRRRPPRLRHRDRALRLGARALGGGDAGRDHLLALGLRPQGLPRKHASAGATWCWKRCTNRATSPQRAVRAKGPSRRCPPRATSSRRRSTPRRPTSPPTCASSWSNATAPRRPSSAASRSSRRSTCGCRKRPKKRSTPTSATRPRPPRWS